MKNKIKTIFKNFIDSMDLNCPVVEEKQPCLNLTKEEAKSKGIPKKFIDGKVKGYFKLGGRRVLINIKD